MYNNQDLMMSSQQKGKMKKKLLPPENAKTDTHRGRPHINIARFVEGRPRMTGLNN